MDAVHCEFCFFASCAWRHQHLCMSACITEPWATYSKQLTGHEFCIVCTRKWLVGSGVHLPPGGGTINFRQPPLPGMGGNPSSLGGGGWTIGGMVCVVCLCVCACVYACVHLWYVFLSVFFFKGAWLYPRHHGDKHVFTGYWQRPDETSDIQ